MSLQDSLSAIIRSEIRSTLSRSQGGVQGGGDFSGLDRYDHLVALSYQNGDGANQAIGAFTSEVSLPTGFFSPIVLSSTDPLVGLSTDTPSSNPGPDGSLRAILIENMSDPVTGNFITVRPNPVGAAGVVGWIEGGNLPPNPPELIVQPGGSVLSTFPGITAPVWTAAGGDELEWQADTAAVQCRFTYLFTTP